MNGRFLFVCGALLLFANAALGDGNYQPTKNGRTLVWNNHPRPGDEATWWGGRDREGYAHGFGTLTWYRVERKSETSSAKPTLYASYWGNMVQGKLDGQVNVHSKGETHYAIFADGVRKTRWASGRAPSGAMAQWRAATAAKQSTVPEPPAAGPVRSKSRQISEVTSQRSEVSDRSTKQDNPQLSTAASAARTNSESFREHGSQPSKGRPKTEANDSSPLWAGPPRSLRKESVGSPAGANPAPPASARLTKEEVVDLAGAAARSHGYDLGEYQSPEPQFDPVDGTWSLLYDEKRVDGRMEIGKHFSVAVDDKTKRTVLVSRN